MTCFPDDVSRILSRVYSQLSGSHQLPPAAPAMDCAALSPTGRILYLANSKDPEGRIYQYSINEVGELGPKRLFFCFATDGREPAAGFDPNGIIVDPDGNVSVARSAVAVRMITKISPRGIVVCEVPFEEEDEERWKVRVIWPEICDFFLWANGRTTERELTVELERLTSIPAGRLRLTRLGNRVVQLDVITAPVGAAPAA